MLKKIFNFVLMANGVSAPDVEKKTDKWAQIRAEREAWEKEQAEQVAAQARAELEAESDASERPGK